MVVQLLEIPYQHQCLNIHCCDCFVNGLKRDKARGQLAPHQLILLLALLAYINKQGSYIAEPEYTVITDICQLNTNFQSIWKQHRHLFSSTNPKIGLPLQSFFNQHLIELRFNSPIDDIRRTEELIIKLDQITLSPKLLSIFLNHTPEILQAYFKARIDC